MILPYQTTAVREEECQREAHLVYMQPPASGEAALLLDDMAMISWQRPLQRKPAMANKTNTWLRFMQ